MPLKNGQTWQKSCSQRNRVGTETKKKASGYGINTRRKI